MYVCLFVLFFLKSELSIGITTCKTDRITEKNVQRQFLVPLHIKGPIMLKRKENKQKTKVKTNKQKQNKQN